MFAAGFQSGGSAGTWPPPDNPGPWRASSTAAPNRIAAIAAILGGEGRERPGTLDEGPHGRKPPMKSGVQVQSRTSSTRRFRARPSIVAFDLPAWSRRSRPRPTSRCSPRDAGPAPRTASALRSDSAWLRVGADAVDLAFDGNLPVGMIGQPLRQLGQRAVEMGSMAAVPKAK